MLGCPERAPGLDPLSTISLIEKLNRDGNLRDENQIRRAISAIYFALFNYWSAEKYNSSERGSGPCKDQWNFKQFFSDVSYKRKELAYPLRFLHSLGVAADHCALNPTKVNIRVSNRKEVDPVSLREEKLKIAVDYAKKIYNGLRSEVPMDV